MSRIETLMSITKVEGEVMLHDGNSGWVRAHPGMVFPKNSEVTIKTGSSGRAEIINTRGELVNLPGNCLKVICDDFSADDVDTLKQITLTARDMMAASIRQRHTIAPAF